MIRFLTAGESHGPALVTVIEGLPAGLDVALGDLQAELARRRHGTGRGRRMAVERDEVEILGGIRFGQTLGSPVAVLVRNTEWPKWEEEMAPLSPGPARRRLTQPRPGHADLAGMLKYDTHDARDILERASARETAARTVAGFLARRLLAVIGVDVLSHVVAIGSVEADGGVPEPGDRERVDASPVRAFSTTASEAMVAEIESAKEDRDTLGGVVEVLGYGVPAGLGSHTHHDRRIDARLAAALMSIPGIKAVEIGDGIVGARRRGSEAHDEISYRDGDFVRPTNRSGGIEGGMTTGQRLRLRAAMKPLSTLMRPLDSVDVDSKEPSVAFRERSDVCAVPAAGVVAEAMTAVVLAQEAQRKFGGDTVEDFAGAVQSYRKRLAEF